jgi:hypothetical protein
LHGNIPVYDEVEGDMRTTSALFVIPIALALAACGANGRVTGEQGATGTETSPALYQATATVLESKQHGPMLCLGGVLTSLPPQCGDVPLRGWDWEAVEGETKAAGTTWGMFHVTGSYADGIFTVVDAGPFVSSPGPEPEVDLSSPCPTPSGGWTGLEHATQNDDDPAMAYIRRQPDHVTSWIAHLDPGAGERSPVIVNVIFTGDAERHEAEIRGLWTGPLCVLERAVPNANELARIRHDAEAALPGLGLQMLWSSGPDVEPVIDIGVVVDPGGKAQAAFEERFGPGRVRLISALQPL